MLRLRFYLIVLLLFTGIAVNIERLDFGPRENIINLDSFVYLLLGVAIMSTVLLPSRWKISMRTLVLFWITVYLLIKVLLREERPAIGGIYTYLTLTELFIVVGSVIFTRRVMENLNSLEETVANITLVDVSNRVKKLDDAIPEISKEFVRSRRYKRPLGLVVIKLKPEHTQVNIDNISKDILKTMVSRYSMSNLIRVIDKDIRRPDLILEHYKENRIILLLPEADLEATRTVSGNIQKLANTKMGYSVATGVAAFPNDALTFEDLVVYAESQIDEGALNKTP